MFRTTNTTIVGASSNATGLTALAGGGQTGATAIAASMNVFGTVATNADSAILPAAKQGACIFVKNRGAATLAVFPAVGETINSGAANASFSVATVKSAIFVATSDGAWDTVLSA